MNKYIITTLRATALALLLAPAMVACTDQEDGNNPATAGLLPLQLKTTIDGGITSLSRAATAPVENEQKTQFDPEDVITLTYTNDRIQANTPSGTQTMDAVYGANGEWTFANGGTVYLNFPSPESVVATYPSHKQLTDAGRDAVGVRLTEGEEEDATKILSCIDALKGVAKPVLLAGGTRAEANITLTHLHQLLNIGIDARTIDGDPTVDIVKVMMKVNYDNGEEEVDYLVEATPGAALEVSEGDNRHFFHAILPATAAEDENNEGTYTLTGADITVRGGRVYELTVNGGREMKPNYRLSLNITLRGDVVDFDFSNNNLGWLPETAPDAEDYDVIISRAEDLYVLAKAISADRSISYLNGDWSPARSARVLQTANIDLAAYPNWTPIGSHPDYPFIGTYNGNGFTISNLKITEAEGNAYGLFGYVGYVGEDAPKAVLAGIRLTGVDITATGGAGGALAGYTKNCVISLCSATEVTVTGNVTAAGTTTHTFGGLVGTAESTSMTRCSANLKSFTYTTVPNAYIGGLVGKAAMNNEAGSEILSCSIAGEMKITASGNLHAGGLAGHIENTSIGSSLSTATLTLNGGTVHAGGVAGEAISSSIITGCYTTGSVSSGANTGALVGVAGTGCTFTYCYGKYGAGTSNVTNATSNNITYKDGGEPNFDAQNNVYTDEVYQIVKQGSSIGTTITSYNSTLYPAYDVDSMDTQWKCSDAWNSGNGYPSIKMTYEGQDIT